MALTKIPGSLLDTASGINGLIYPTSDGTAGQFLKTDGSGNLAFATVTGYTDSDVETYLDGGTSTPTFASATVSGALTVTGDLNITGDINSYNVTDLDVTDQTITLGAGQIEANSGGSGIIVDGSNASILWDETNDTFDINKGLTTTGNVGIGQTSPQAGLDLGSSAKGTWSSGNTYHIPSGNAYIKVQGTAAQDNWIGITGGYDQSSGSANLLLQANIRLVNEQAGNYISSEAQSSTSADITFGKMVGGSTTSGNSTKSEFMRINSSGNVLIGHTSVVPIRTINQRVQISGTDQATAGLSLARYQNGAFAPGIHLAKSRNATVGAHTIVQDGDRLGDINFYGSDGVDFSNHAATIMCEVDGTPGNDDTPGRLTFHTTADGSGAATERMRIDSSGNVGIGAAPTNFSNYNNLDVRSKNTSGGAIIGIHDTDGVRVGGISHSESSPAFDIEAFNSNPLRFFTNNTERMRIGIDGRVGIGNVGYASVALAVNSGSNNYVLYGESTDAKCLASFRDNSSTSNIEFGAIGNNHVLSSDGTERMRITSGGNVLIGTSTTPAYPHKLVCSGSAIPDGTVSFRDTDATVGLANAVMSLGFTNDADATNGYFIYMTDANGAIGSISAASGTSVSFNTTSDERLKKNIVDASPQLDIIKSIKVREFDWTRNDHHELGLIAQELVEIVPNVVTDGGEDETKNPYGVDYGKLTPYLIKAIQEQQTIIDDLKSRIETLEG